MEEILTVFDEGGCPIGAAPRSRAHAEGLLHQVAHIWVVSPRGDGMRIWFQQRSFAKADFPGLHDFAVGGHIAHGEAVLPAAMREMEEEIGIVPAADRLVFLGDHRTLHRLPGFFDREIARVFLYEDPVPLFAPGEEVERMVSVSAADYVRFLEAGGDVTAETADGRETVISPDEWCPDNGEFMALVLPRLG